MCSDRSQLNEVNSGQASPTHSQIYSDHDYSDNAFVDNNCSGYVYADDAYLEHAGASDQDQNQDQAGFYFSDSE